MREKSVHYCCDVIIMQITTEVYYHHKVREYFVYRDDHGLGCMPIHLAHHCFSFNIRWI